jgi:hypothetical protein
MDTIALVAGRNCLTVMKRIIEARRLVLTRKGG